MKRIGGLVLVVLLLTACGGGGAKNGPAATVPAGTTLKASPSAPATWTKAEAAKKYLDAVTLTNSLSDQIYLGGPFIDLSRAPLADKAMQASQSLANLLKTGKWPAAVKPLAAALSPVIDVDVQNWKIIATAATPAVANAELKSFDDGSAGQAAKMRTALGLPQYRAPSLIGRAARNVGAAVTVTSVAAAASIQESDDYGNYSAVTPAAGGHFVVVTGKVTNDAKVSMDLTCGYPIANKLEDSSGRQYDQIEKVYSVRGNPECNANLQPGFSEQMQWVYLVPNGTKVVDWLFTDETDPTSQPDLGTLVTFPAV